VEAFFASREGTRKKTISSYVFLLEPFAKRFKVLD
jgi:hypothetical protein